MGGISSGRYRTRNRGTVEASLRVDIRRLRREGHIKAGERHGGVLQWNRRGAPAGAIGYVIDLVDPDNWHACLMYSVDGEKRTQRVAVVSDPCRLGGQRFYFVCPRTFQRCELLCGFGGYFASRQFHRLTYITQSADELGRLVEARLKAEARALGTKGYPRPRGANRRRLVKRWIGADMAADDLFAIEGLRRFGRFF